MKTKIAVAIMVTTALSGCGSTPSAPEKVEFETNHSYAYNIANQTALLRNDSPLKDFSQAEVSEIKTDLAKKTSGGDASLVLGTLSILTGNLTGIIEVAGGSAANLANSDHIASHPRWIVSVPVNNYNNELEAQQYIYETIQSASNRYYAQFGEVTVSSYNESSIYDDTKVTIGNKTVSVALVSDKTDRTPDGNTLVAKTTTGLSNELVYAYGFDVDSSYLHRAIITPTAPTALISQTKIDVTYDEVMKGITANLPENFFFYAPSFPKQSAYDGDTFKNYVDSSQVVPAIYTQGKQYLFMKP